jgi:hypothetical protein
MIDVDKLAEESGASCERINCLEWWRFSPDELQLFAEKVMLAAQAAERERIMKALDAALMLRGGIPSEALLLARSAIAKYEGEINEP